MYVGSLDHQSLLMLWYSLFYCYIDTQLSGCSCYLLRKGGYVFGSVWLFVRLFVSNITEQELLEDNRARLVG